MAPRRAPGYDRKCRESNRRKTLLCRRATRQKAKVGVQGEQVRDERSQGQENHAVWVGLLGSRNMQLWFYHRPKKGLKWFWLKHRSKQPSWTQVLSQIWWVWLLHWKTDATRPKSGSKRQPKTRGPPRSSASQGPRDFPSAPRTLGSRVRWRLNTRGSADVWGAPEPYPKF